MKWRKTVYRLCLKCFHSIFFFSSIFSIRLLSAARSALLSRLKKLQNHLTNFIHVERVSLSHVLDVGKYFWSFQMNSVPPEQQQQSLNEILELAKFIQYIYKCMPLHHEAARESDRASNLLSIIWLRADWVLCVVRYELQKIKTDFCC